MIEDKIKQHMARGLTREQACSLLGVPFKPERAPDKVDKDALRNMAIDTLATLIADMQAQPAAFKPNEIIAACKEALDRTEGKAAQSIAIDNTTTVTHKHIMSMDPSMAYRRMIEGLEVIEHDT